MPLNNYDDVFCATKAILVPRFSSPLPTVLIVESRKRIIDFINETLPFPFEDITDLISWFSECLPFVQFSKSEGFPQVLSIVVICQKKTHFSVEQTFLNHLNSLYLEKTTSFFSFYGSYFTWKGISNVQHFLGKAQFIVCDVETSYSICAQLPSWCKEMISLFQEPHHFYKLQKARDQGEPHTLEAFSEFFSRCWYRYPNAFDRDLFVSLAQIFNETDREFRESRSFRTLLRLIISQYYLLQQLSQEIENDSPLLHAVSRVFSIQSGVIGVCVALFFSNRDVNHSESALLGAARSLIPTLEMQPNSLYRGQENHSHRRFFYLELKKEGGANFSLLELKKLKSSLSNSLCALLPTCAFSARSN